MRLHPGFFIAALCLATSAGAQETPPVAPAPAPYSLPWQLRPAAIGTVVRSDTSFAFHESGGSDGLTIASTLLASYRLTPEFAPLVRVAVVSNDPPAGESATIFANPVVGGTYLWKLTPDLRLAGFLGVAIPLGQGGGNTPEAAEAAAARAAIPARSAMDNAMFAVNDFTVFPGLGLAWVRGGFTVQVEATVLQLTRVRGEAKQADESRTNFTSGVHVGWFPHSLVSLGGELRHQRWLSTPANVKADASARDTSTAAIGARLHFKLPGNRAIRPGLSYTLALDEPVSKSDYQMLQLDVPFFF